MLQLMALSIATRDSAGHSTSTTAKLRNELFEFLDNTPLWDLLSTGPRRLLKLIISQYRATGRQLPSQLRHILQPPPQFDLGLEQSVASVAVVRAFPRKAFGMQ